MMGVDEKAVAATAPDLDVGAHLLLGFLALLRYPVGVAPRVR
jgi:hypothetical protein